MYNYSLCIDSVENLDSGILCFKATVWVLAERPANNSIVCRSCGAYSGGALINFFLPKRYLHLFKGSV